MTRKPVAIGYRPTGPGPDYAPDFTSYRVQVVTYCSDDPTDYTSQTLTFPDKREAMAFAKRAGMDWTIA